MTLKEQLDKAKESLIEVMVMLDAVVEVHGGQVELPKKAFGATGDACNFVFVKQPDGSVLLSRPWLIDEVMPSMAGTVQEDDGA